MIIPNLNTPEYWIAVIVGAGLHEVGHVLTAMSFGVKVKRFGINWRGPYIVRSSGTPKQNIFITFAGPFVNLILGFVGIALGFHIFAFVNFFLFVMNMLPLKIADGRKIIDNIKLYRAESVNSTN
jgi:Zn-dependent protease